MKYFSLILAATIVIIFSVAPLTVADASTRTDVRRLVVEEALNSNVPPSLAMAVAKIESNFQSQALSPAGARGVMQIMPATAMGEYGVGAEELWDARLNVQLGIDFLGRLISRYGGRWDLALSHYNSGSVTRTRSNMEPLPETRNYVKTVLNWQKRYAEQATIWAQAETSEDGWRPARTRDTARKNIEPQRIVVREIETKQTQQHSTWQYTTQPQSDFGAALKQRVLRMRGTLDDFTMAATTHDG
ncbi:MAG: hypothetical protein CMM54_11010 [Rhodospirillaceae bacterium]|nr:hypothetical protein [Rhodospirillaceae bacterium]|tara:strand:- start:4163 stop:4897 length:735 start_codon:yes stop_codon:yes gene_type:complete